MLKIAICDDEVLIVKDIEKRLSDICFSKNIEMQIQSFYNGYELENAITGGMRYDIIYMDIRMDEESGITVAENIRKKDENVIFIYVSGYEEYMIDLFHLDVFAFIRKPIDGNRFETLFMDAYEKASSKAVYFSFKYKSDEYKILCKDILYFESKGRILKIFIRSGETLKFNGKLSQIEERLQDSKIPFLRIHQSFLVNYHYIKSRSKTCVKMSDGTQLSISEDRKKAFEEGYGRLLEYEIKV